MACNYCYVPRRKGYANPVTVFVNIERILGYLERHVARQGPKKIANQCDPVVAERMPYCRVRYAF